MRFSSRQRGLAIDALEEAEIRTSDYYCIPPFRWQSVRYDLLTGQDPEWQPLPDDMLARTQRLHREKRPGDFFRIELNDPGILTAARREDLWTDLYPFLLYILTHEMVHLVRLSHILADSEQHSVTRDIEEMRVCQIVRSILAVPPTPCLNNIIRRFSFGSSSFRVKDQP